MFAASRSFNLPLHHCSYPSRGEGPQLRAAETPLALGSRRFASPRRERIEPQPSDGSSTRSPRCSSAPRCLSARAARNSDAKSRGPAEFLKTEHWAALCSPDTHMKKPLHVCILLGVARSVVYANNTENTSRDRNSLR